MFFHLPMVGSAAFPKAQKRYIPFLAVSKGDLHHAVAEESCSKCHNPSAYQLLLNKKVATSFLATRAYQTDYM